MNTQELQAVQEVSATQFRRGVWRETEDAVVVEEPLEIRVDGRRFTTTMRTPGHDELLARGLLFTEGIIGDNDDIEKIVCSTRCRDGDLQDNSDLINVVDATLFEPSEAPAHLWERALISNSSCGLCGKASVEALSARVAPLATSGAKVAAETLLALPDQMRQMQPLFSQTGGLHAAGLFDARGNCLALFEDIGRHNASDKAIGRGLEAGWLPWDKSEPIILLVSGRASFEIVQKAIVARVPIVCSVSAASSLAVELARANNQTLVGFLRPEAMTIYSASERIETELEPPIGRK